MLRASFIIICSIITVAAGAQSTANKELKSIIESSFTHFPKLKEAENSIAIAEEKKKLIELSWQPDITADAGYAYVKPKIVLPINNQKFQFAPVDNFNAGFNGTMALIDFGRLKAAIQQSKNELAITQHGKENLQHQLAYQVANIYYYVIYLKKGVAIQDTIISSLNENKKIIESQVKNGTALEIDLLSINSGIDAEENRKTELNTLLNKQLILLEYASGIGSTNGNDFDFNIPATPQISNYDINPDMVLLNDKVQQSKQDVFMSQLKNKPMLNMRASMGGKNGYLPNIYEMRFNYMAGVSFSVPIYNGGKLKQQIKLQQSIANLQSTAVESMKQTLDKDVKQNYADIVSARERLSRAASQITLAKTASQLATNKLKHGTGTHLEVTSANTNLQRTLLNELQLQFQLCTASLEYARLTGVRIW